MIQWSDDALLLTARPFGETAVIAEVFTPAHGRVAGVVRGGISRKLAPHLQPGAQLTVTWQARLQEHLGSLTVEPDRGRMASVLGDRLALAGLNAVCALLPMVLPEGEPHAPLYRRTVQLMDLLGQGDLWPLAYLHWEMALLEELGFGLDLSCCAVTGATDDLVFVSPKSGRAVSRAGAGEWAGRMLALPPVLARQGSADDAEIVVALGTTGWFVEHRLIRSLGDKPMPEARARLLAAITRAGGA